MLLLCGVCYVEAWLRVFGARKPSRCLRLQVASPDKLFSSDINEIEDDTLQERNLRFAGIGRLYAAESTVSDYSESSVTAPPLEILNRLASSTVMVVGLGGVGSWAAEALCRSGVGTLVLVDLDDICISNTNRQLHTTASSIGQLKLDEMKRRLNDINPHCNVTLIHDFVSAENVNEILDSCTDITALCDCIDGANEKAALLAAGVNRGIPIVTCGAAAGLMDPTKITVDDLTNVQNDRLLASCRRYLRKHYNFERGISKAEMNKISNRERKKREWKIRAVYSPEVPKAVCQEFATSSFRLCDGPMGTACFFTGACGFVLASLVVDMIATNNLVCPRKQQHAAIGHQ